MGVCLGGGGLYVGLGVFREWEDSVCTCALCCVMTHLYVI